MPIDLTKLNPCFRQIAPGLVKGLLCAVGAVFLINANSLPLVWHYRVLRHVWRIRLRYLLFRLSLIGKPKAIVKQLKEKWLDGLAPVGSDPWEAVTKLNRFAGLDECDFNMHLSNSSYAKVLDEARMQSGIASFPNFFRAGGWMALGGTHYTFHREIPLLSSYEMRLSVGSWDEKWLYLVTRYVSHPKDKRSKVNKDAVIGSVPSLDTAPAPVIHTPATGANTPTVNSDSYSSAAMRLLAASTLSKEEPDGATLHCLNISEICFKVGRVTVPPALALALNGFCGASPSDKPYSVENAPPHMEHVRKLLSNPKDAQAFLRGGWREVPQEDRWWEQALGGDVEEKRKVSLELIQGVRRGMEGAKAVY